MKVLCNFSYSRFSEKPKADAIRIIQSELSKPEEIEVEELANMLVNGCNFRPGATNGKTDADFVSQQIFGLDFDNTESIIQPQEAVSIAKSKGLYPCFLYSTFSSKEEKPKFRMIFLLNEAITDIQTRNDIQSGFMKIFENHIDKKCGNAARIFFGSQAKKLLYADFERTNSREAVLKYSEQTTRTEKPVKEKKLQKTTKKYVPSVVYGNIEAIQKHDVAYLQKSLNIKKKTTFQNRQEFFNYLYKKINLAELLEVEEKEMFCCVLPEHEDKNPSANVFREKYGSWKYHCFGCDASLNTKQVVEVLGGFNSEYQAINFIKEVYMLDIKETEWAKEQIANIDTILDCLTGATNEEAFSIICPQAAINTRNAVNTFIQILLIAKSSILPDRASSDNGNIIFYMSDNQIMRMCGKNSKSQLHRYLKLLAYHKMIIPLADEEIPKSFLNNALRNRANEKHNRISFYSIPSWVYERTKLIEQQGQKWKDNGYKIKSISYEMFLRTEGQEVAAELFPQYKTIATKDGLKIRTTTKASDKLYSQVTQIIAEIIQQKGYCKEAEVIQSMQNMGISKEKADYRLKQYLPDILACNCLKKCRCNNELKKKFDIETAKNSFPYIIIESEV